MFLTFCRILLRFVMSAIANPLPFFKKAFHLELIEYGFPYKSIQREGKFFSSLGDHREKHDQSLRS